MARVGTLPCREIRIIAKQITPEGPAWGSLMRPVAKTKITGIGAANITSRKPRAVIMFALPIRIVRTSQRRRPRIAEARIPRETIQGYDPTISICRRRVVVRNCGCHVHGGTGRTVRCRVHAESRSISFLFSGSFLDCAVCRQKPGGRIHGRAADYRQVL